MKITDLMIGDWVSHKGNPTKIRTIEIYNVDIGPYRICGLTVIDVSMLKPIPLTQEILEKNYSSTPEWYFDGTNKYCLRISRYKDKWNFYYGRGGNGVQIQINIQYVHELQHALRLCGIEKEIVL